MANLSNLNPQQLQNLQQQAVVTQLQAPNEYGTEKLLINVNGQNSKIQSNKNSIVKYTLEQPVKLEIGDRVTLIESFVEERGLSIDTISFEEDVEEEMRFLYYMQGDCRNSQNGKGANPYDQTNCADQEFQCFPNVYPDCVDPSTNLDTPGDVAFTWLGQSDLAFKNPYLFPNRNYTSHAAAASVLSESTTVDGQVCGANGQYYYLCESFNPYNEDPSGLNPIQWTAGFQNQTITTTGQNAEACWIRPFYGSATIKIPAGNYSVSALSDLINTQLNGSAIANYPNIDKLQNKLYKETNDLASSVTLPYFSNLNTKSTMDASTPDNIYNPDVDIIGADIHQPYQRRRGQMVAELYFNCNMTANRLNFEVMRSLPAIDPANLALNPKYPNGTSIGLNAGYANLVSGALPSYKPNINTISQQLPFPLLFDGSIDRKYLYRSNGVNFYLHLDAFKTIFGSDDYNGYYYNKDYTSTTALETGQWSPRFLPTLQDIFAQNLGEKGKFYFDNNMVTYNLEGYPDQASRDFDEKIYYSTLQDLLDPKHFKWQCMLPVKSSGDRSIPLGDPFISNGTISQFAGTSSFELNYDTTSANRFSILNLHEPYKMASRTPDNKSDTNVGGQQATIFNTPTYISNTKVDDVDEVFIGQIPFPKCGIYPIDSAGGIAVNNFSFSSVKNTKIYKDLVSTINSLNTSNGDYQMAREKAIFDLFSKPYEDFFESSASAEQAWNSTLWSRLGFTYDQLGAVKNNLETIYTFSKADSDLPVEVRAPVLNPRYIKQMGIITHNAFDYTFIPSSSGLGTGNPYSNASASQNPQNYGLRAYTSGASLDDLAANIGFLQNYVNILSNSRPINAFNFPSLNNGNNYLVIESDIVKTNAKDSNSNSTTIVGIMSKQNASNDTIYSVSPTTFIVTEPKLLATIEVKIKNPDGTLVSDEVVGKNNGFVFMVEKAVKVGEIAGMSF
jgi:hypothetical protein